MATHLEYFPEKVIYEGNNLTLQTYYILQNIHQLYYDPLYHCIILVQGLTRQYLLYIPSHKIFCLGFPDNKIRFSLVLEVLCSYKYIAISNICPWNLFPRRYDVIRNRIPWNHISCVPHKTCNFIFYGLNIFIHMFTW